MELLSRLCFLVLVISSVSRGENDPTDAPERTNEDSTPAPFTDNEPKDDDINSTATPSSPQSHTTVNATDSPLQDSPRQTFTPRADQKDDVTVNPTTKEVEANATAETIAPTSVPKSGKGGESVDVTTTVSTATDSSSSKPVTIEASDHSSWGYVILVLIILVIIALCVILYILRRVSRTYSFDLQRPVHVNHLDEPIGTFEPVYLDDLDQPAPKDEVSTEEIPPAPAANGTTVQSEENGSAGENVAPASEDQPDNKRDSLLQKFDYLYEDEQQNENNNNPSSFIDDPQHNMEAATAAL
ncbi:hypothetical protein D9C73_026752 [Collichthys lucidus]|uniref:Uncharacterized protein n=1 Tax=Collichthys lucidus TaxID=240159 RepID=A0A4U5VXZ2_COLLU|nr:hypothetical protein D9C73_026752 [Collichthys lucidus]